MQINTFTNQQFGNLTTFTNEKTGVVYFIGKEISGIWGHSNLTQSIKASKLNKEEYRTVTLSEFPNLKTHLSNLKLATSKTPRITLLTESGVYKLALSSNLDKAKPFKDWVTQEVLHSIRKTRSYSLVNQTSKVLIHSNVAIQKSNSKEINAKNFFERGLEATIEYNRDSCLLHTGHSPSTIKKIGKEAGLKTAQCNSAKEVLRNLKPELAAAMSFSDSLVKQGFDLKTVSELSLKAAVPLFQGMIELGINPQTLEQ